jgi:hypothetical protein
MHSLHVIASFECEFLELHAFTPWSTFKQSKSLEENNSILHMQISQKGFPKKRKKKEERERERERGKGGACCVSYHVTIE